jgi:hypothetical protein
LLEWITDARTDRYYGAPLPFKPSRAGTWTAGRVKSGRIWVTLIALYGLLDERSDASVHRSLSELTPIFEHPKYRKYLLMGGDLNIFANPLYRDPTKARHESVLKRIEALGLHSCMARNVPKRKPLKGCPCNKPSTCVHQRTYLGTKTSQPYEEDFLFASEGLVVPEKLTSCDIVKDITASDHAPLKATFAI